MFRSKQVENQVRNEKGVLQLAIIKGIVAVDGESGIGYQNKLIIRNQEDLTIFREKTNHAKIIMGRKTFQSLPNVLPDRKHFVFTRKEEQMFPADVEVIHNFVELVDSLCEDEVVWVIGGAEIYRLLENWIDEWHITRFEQIVEQKDVYFNVDLSVFKLEDTQALEHGGIIEVWKRTL